MDFNIGIDIEETHRFRKLVKNQKFLNLIFSKRELDYCKNKKEPYISLTGKFCAKEAVIKASEKRIDIKDIEVIKSKNNNKLEVFIKGKRNAKINCSISHTKSYAVGMAIIKE